MKSLNTPFLGANDDEATFNGWLVAAGSRVEAGMLVATVETTKAVLDVEAEYDGILHPLVERGARVVPGQPLAILAGEPIDDLQAALAALSAEADANIPFEVRVTKKAEILMRRHGIVLEQLGADTSVVDEAAVSQFVEQRAVNERRLGIGHLQRVGVIGGVGGGGAMIVIDSLLRSYSQQPVCVFERDKVWHGRTVLGVPVIGSLEALSGMLEREELDAVVIAFNRDLGERASLFERLTGEGVPFCNVIDARADLRSLVTVGNGNVILANVYLGAGTRVGDNNFISANVFLEHGNQLGNANAFGPGVFTSGNVTIGDRVRFATGIFVEPGITIGDGAVIASGSVLTVDVPASTTVKAGRRAVARATASTQENRYES
ncbi:biotin/lipoyl-containing protein [Halochromatium salexigens]|uniref:Lipoyl-binding domain-containing protein n=1 Tax=Halochromatium salexigens TaxID=49447 RepID=A0AAJ0UEQ5_HALSE|nr:biotin/lipoyl-containing protein [Halochromatium salexigens]MBK5929948.1 hypothetical protein [Halochromatium salexigens]